MALPAQVAPAVGRHVDARNLFRAARLLGVAAAAELAGAGLVGAHESRRDLMLHTGLVALGAGQQDVARNGLRPSDFPMASAALLGHVGRFRPVGVVTTDAGLERVVDDGINLRETARAAGVVAVAERAIAPFAGCWQANLRGILGVRRGGPVANLTADRLMVALAVGRRNLRMAQGARLAPGVLNLLVLDSYERGGAVVTPFAKGLRHVEVPGHGQGDGEQGKNNEETIELLRHQAQAPQNAGQARILSA